MQRNTQILYGSSTREGIELSHHVTSQPFSDSLVDDALHILFNLEGSVLLMGPSLRVSLTAQTIGLFYKIKKEDISANCLPSETQNTFLLLSVSTQWIEKNFGSKRSALHPDLSKILDTTAQHSSALGKVRNMSLVEKDIAEELISPPVTQEAQPFWYLAKTLETLTLHLFAPSHLEQNSPFCSQLKQHNKTRIKECITWLKNHLDEPLDLNILAKQINCSPHYLSRQFKKHTGMTLKHKHRELRINHAAQLLLDGDYNVTEAAMEVGYHSLSHFSKAFQEVKGELPSSFILKD